MVSADEEDTLTIIPPVQIKNAGQKKRGGSRKRAKSQSEEDNIVVFGLGGEVHRIRREFVFYTKTKPSLSFSKDRLKNLTVSAKTSSLPQVEENAISEKNDCGEATTPLKNGDNGVSKKHKKRIKKKKKSSDGPKSKKKKSKNKSKAGRKEKHSKQNKKKEKRKHKKKDKELKNSESRGKRKREHDLADEEHVQAKVRKVAGEDHVNKEKEKKKSKKKRKKEKRRSCSRSVVHSALSEESKIAESNPNSLDEDLSDGGQKSPKWTERNVSYKQQVVCESEGKLGKKHPDYQVKDRESADSFDQLDSMLQKSSIPQPCLVGTRTVRLGGPLCDLPEKSVKPNVHSQIPNSDEPLSSATSCSLDTKLHSSSNLFAAHDFQSSDVLVNLPTAQKDLCEASPEKYDPFECNFEDLDEIQANNSKSVAKEKLVKQKLLPLTQTTDRTASPILGVNAESIPKNNFNSIVDSPSMCTEGAKPNQQLSGKSGKDVNGYSNLLPKTMKICSAGKYFEQSSSFMKETTEIPTNLSGNNDSVKNSGIVGTDKKFEATHEETNMVLKKSTSIAPVPSLVSPSVISNEAFLSAEDSAQLFFSQGKSVSPVRASDECALKRRKSSREKENGLGESNRLASVPGIGYSPLSKVPSSPQDDIVLEFEVPKKNNALYSKVPGSAEKTNKVVSSIVEKNIALPVTLETMTAEALSEIVLDSDGEQPTESSYVPLPVPMCVESSSDSDGHTSPLPSPTEIPLPDSDICLPPLPPGPQLKSNSCTAAVVVKSKLPSYLTPELPASATPIPMPISPLSRYRGVRPASGTFQSTKMLRPALSKPPPRPNSVIPPPRPRSIAPLPISVPLPPSSRPTHISEQSPSTPHDMVSDDIGKQGLLSEGAQHNPTFGALPVATPTTMPESISEPEKEPVKIKFALKTLPSRMSKVIKYTVPDDGNKKVNDGVSAGEVHGCTPLVEKVSSVDSEPLGCCELSDEPGLKTDCSNLKSGTEIVVEGLNNKDCEFNLAEQVGGGTLQSQSEPLLGAVETPLSSDTKSLHTQCDPGLDSHNCLLSEGLGNNSTPSLTPSLESSIPKTKTTREKRSRSRSPRKRSRSPRRSRSKSPRRKSPKRPRRSPPRNRRRSPDRRSVSPSAQSSPPRRSSTRLSPHRRSPRRSSPRSSSPPPRSSPSRISLPRSSPSRRSPRHSPARMSPSRKFHRRSPSRLSPPRRSPRRSPRPSPPRRSPRRSPRMSPSRRSPRRSPSRSSPRRSPRRHRYHRRSPRRRSPPRPVFRRTSPKRTPPREFSPRRSPAREFSTPRDTIAASSPSRKEASPRRWSPKRLPGDSPLEPFMDCPPCFSPGFLPVEPPQAPYQAIPVLCQVPIVDEIGTDQAPCAIQTITSHIERQEVAPRSRKQAIHETVLIHIEPCAIPLPEDGLNQPVGLPASGPKPEEYEEMEISSVSSDELEDFPPRRISLDDRLRVELENNDEESCSSGSLGGGWNLNSSRQFSSEGSELIRTYMEELEKYYASLRDYGGYVELPPPVTLVRVGNTLRVIPNKPSCVSSQVPVKPAISKVRMNGANSSRRVMFADNVRPGEGTSPSCGEDMSSPPPPLRKKRVRKKKTPSPPDDDMGDLKAELEPPPPPPVGSPPEENSVEQQFGASPVSQKLLSKVGLESRPRDSPATAFQSPVPSELQLTAEQILLNLNIFSDSNSN